MRTRGREYARRIYYLGTLRRFLKAEVPKGCGLGWEG